MGFGLSKIGIIVFAVAVLFPAQVLAGLGDDERSVEVDRRALSGDKSVATTGSYRVYEIHTNSRQTVREYVSLTGSVFAITWRGARQPDLSQLFGTYYNEYLAAERVTPPSVGRAPRTTESTNVRVHKFGHMGDVRGKAYIPMFVPDGVDPKGLP